MIEAGPHHRVRMVSCSICGANLESQVPAAHIAREHLPEDLGLSPLGGGQ